ncbi:MAG: S8 family serine peptidase, partial [Caldilineaceae bacterium]
MRKLASLLAVIAILLTVIPVSAKGDPTARGNGKIESGGSSAYIVQMVDPPVVAYRGGVKGLKATAPRKGQKIDPNSPEVQAYMGYLRGKHDTALANIGAQGKKFYSYGIVFNGFAARLSEADVAALRGQPGVVTITKDVIRKLDTATTPAFLGLSGPYAPGLSGLWNDASFKGRPGEGVIVGIVDSGLWPENPSFSDRTGT